MLFWIICFWYVFFANVPSHADSSNGLQSLNDSKTECKLYVSMLSGRGWDRDDYRIPDVMVLEWYVVLCSAWFCSCIHNRNFQAAQIVLDRFKDRWKSGIDLIERNSNEGKSENLIVYSFKSNNLLTNAIWLIEVLIKIINFLFLIIVI